jgi:hypothetical protein
MPIVKAIIYIASFAVTLSGAVMAKETKRIYRRQY